MLVEASYYKLIQNKIEWFKPSLARPLSSGPVQVTTRNAVLYSRFRAGTGAAGRTVTNAPAVLDVIPGPLPIRTNPGTDTHTLGPWITPAFIHPPADNTILVGVVDCSRDPLECIDEPELLCQPKRSSAGFNLKGTNFLFCAAMIATRYTAGMSPYLPLC